MANWARRLRNSKQAPAFNPKATSTRLTEPASAAKPTLVDWYFRATGKGPRPSVSDALAQHPLASPADVTTVLCAELAHRWRDGEHVPAEEYLEQFPDVLAADENAIDLIYAEYLEREKAGEAPTPGQYVARFPQFAEALQTQIEFHQAIQEPILNPPECRLAETVPAGSDSATDGRTTSRPSESWCSTANVVRPDSRASNRLEIQGYEILEEIGRGGMGVVFKARHRQLDRLVALKMLLEGPFSNPNHARRFLVEAKASARLQHPGIVQIHEVGQHDGRPFLAFEYIDGGTLADHIRGRPIQPMAAAAIVEALARAVQFAHERSVVHRDLKPSNVMLQQIESPANASVRSANSKSNHGLADAAGERETADAQLPNRFQFKITDFGLAKFVEDHADPVSGATIAGDIMGTAAYMSPEQARGDSTKPSAASDIYSLGAILYELLTGRPPFVGTRPIEVLAQVVADEPVRPSQLVRRMPADLQTICLKCLEKNPQRRYGSAVEMAEELARFQANLPILARHRTRLERGWSWCRRHPVTAVSLTSIATLLLAVTVVTTVYSFLLSDQLAQTKSAESAESDAKQQAIERLWGSYLAEAKAKRNSRQIGQRVDGLAAIQSAQVLGASIELNEQQRASMREAAIACLALPDVQVVKEFSRSATMPLSGTFDGERTRYAYVAQPNRIIVKRSADDSVIAEISTTGTSFPLLSRDGKRLMMLNDHCRIFRLDESPGEQIFETKSRGWWSFSTDGTRILGAVGDGQLSLIDIETGTTIRSFGPWVVWERPLFSPDDSQVALVTREAIEVLDLKTGEIRQRFNRPFVTGNAQPCAWHPNGKVLAIGPYETEGVVLWDVGTGAKLDAVGMWGGSFTPYFNSSGSLLLGYANWSSTLSVWNTVTRQMEFRAIDYPLRDPKPTANGGFNFLTPVGDVFSTTEIDPSPILRSLPMPLGYQAIRFNPEIAYSQNGHFLAHGFNGQVLIYETSTWRMLDRVLTGDAYGFVGFDAAGSLLTITDLGLVRWPISAGGSDPSPDSDVASAGFTFGPPETLIGGVNVNSVRFAVSRDGDQFAVSTTDGVLVYRDGANNNPQFLGPHPDVRSMSFSADGKCLATGGWGSGTARIWNIESGQLLKTLDEPICCMVEFSPDGQFLVTNSNRVGIWSTENWERLAIVAVQGESPSGVMTCFSPDSQLLAISDAVARIQLVDPTTGTILTTLTNPHEAGASSMSFNPTSDRLAVAFAGSVHVWDLVALQESLVDFELGWTRSENPLAASLHRPSEQPSSRTSEESSADDGGTGGSQRQPMEEQNARFVLDPHFQQLAVAERIQRAQVAVERGEMGAARDFVRQAISEGTESSSNCNNLAWLLATGPAAVRDPAQAEILARRAVAAAPDQPMFLNTLGVTLYRIGKYTEAIETLQKSLQHSERFNQPYDLFFLAMSHAQLGDFDKARDYQNLAAKLMADQVNGQTKQWHDELLEFSSEARATLSLCESRAPAAASDFD